MGFSGSSRAPTLSLLAAFALAACAPSHTPPPAVGGDDKAITNPDDLGKDDPSRKKGPTFYEADAPPPGAALVTDPAGPSVPGGPVRLAPVSGSTGARSIKVLAPGDAPLEKRVYSPKVGAKETLTISTKTSTTASAGGQPLPGGDVGLPPATLEIGFVVKEVSDGQIKSEFVVRKATCKPKGSGEDPTAKYAAGVQALKGAKGTVTTTRGGDAVTVQIDDAESDANKDLLRDHLLTPAVPFPEAPIGSGAKWEVRGPVTAPDGMRTDQSTTYELTDLSKGKGKVSVTTGISAPEQDLQVGGPITPHLKRLEGSGKGSASFDFAKITARSYTVASSSKSTISMSLLGSETLGEMSSKSDTKRVGK